jgi:histidine triad (HIT) family protein
MAMSAGCTFCRILRGELPKVFVEDGRHAVAFLDRNQAARGHLLIVARAHVASWHELDEATISEMALMSHRWSRRLTTVLHVQAYNLLVNNGAAAGQDVMHAHLHLTPRVTGDGYYEFGYKVTRLAEDEVHALEALLIGAAGENDA